MRLRYFIDYRFDDKLEQFLPIGIWIQDVDDSGIDMYYPDETSDQYWESQWIISWLVESDMNVPPDFLEFHQAEAGYCGMRSKIFAAESALNIDEFMSQTLRKYMVGEG
jgi:hypothetical protein